VVLLPFLLFPSDDTLFIAPDRHINVDHRSLTKIPIHYYRFAVHCTRHTFASSLTNILICYYYFVVHTNTIIYNKQHQQKNEKEKEKESGKECYYLLYCSHCSSIQYMSNCRTITYYMYIHDEKAHE